MIANCFSYVASMAGKEERTLRVSVVEGMQLLAAMGGPFLSKLIKHHLGTRAVFAGKVQIGSDLFRSDLKETSNYCMSSQWNLLLTSTPLLPHTERTKTDRRENHPQPILRTLSAPSRQLFQNSHSQKIQ